MAISFELIPNNLRVPGIYGEFNNRFAVSALVRQPYKILLIGQALELNTVTSLKPVAVNSADQAAAWFGRGSMIQRMVSAFRDNDPLTELVVMAQRVVPGEGGEGEAGEAVSGLPASGQIRISGNAIEAGLLSLYMGGQRVRVYASLKCAS